MSRTRLGGLLVVLGAVVLVLSLLADSIGLGSGGSAIGWKQITGAIIGAAVLTVGALILYRGRDGTDQEQPDADQEQPEATA